MKFYTDKAFNIDNSKLIRFNKITESDLSKRVVNEFNRLKALLKRDKMLETGKKVNELNEAVDSLKIKLIVDKHFMNVDTIGLKPNLIFNGICDLVSGDSIHRLFARDHDKLAVARIIVNDKYLLENNKIPKHIIPLLKEVDHDKIELYIVPSDDNIYRIGDEYFELVDSEFMSKMYYSYVLLNKAQENNEEAKFSKYAIDMISKYDECFRELFSSIDGFSFDKTFEKEDAEFHLLQTKKIELENKATLEKLENELKPINDSTFVKQLAYMDENYLFLKDEESSYEDVKFKGKINDSFSFKEIVSDAVYFNLIDSEENKYDNFIYGRLYYENGIHFMKSENLVNNSKFMKSADFTNDLRSSTNTHLLICHKDDKDELIDLNLKKYNRELATPTFFEIETPTGFDQLSIIGVTVSKEVTEKPDSTNNYEVKLKAQSIISDESKFKSGEKVNNLFGIGQSDVYSDKELKDFSMIKKLNVFYEEINIEFDSDELFLVLVFFNSVMNYKQELIKTLDKDCEDPYMFTSIFSSRSSDSAYKKQIDEFHSELMKEIDTKKDNFDYKLQFVLINIFSSYFKLRVKNEEKLESPAFKQHLLSL